MGDRGPAVLAARARILAAIDSIPLAAGQRIGAERELAERFEVSRSTLRDALDDLERDGTVVRGRGRGGGIFVAPRKIERDLTSIAGLPEYLHRQGFQSDARVISTATIAAGDQVARKLSLQAGELIHEIVRLRLANGTPISLERASFPAERFPGLLDHSLGGSVYELLAREYDLAPAQAEERIEVLAADGAQARLLDIGRGAPIVSIMRTAWDGDGNPFEVSHDLFRGDQLRIVVRASSGSSLSDGFASALEARSDAV